MALPLQTMIPINGEIESISITNTGNVWSDGVITIGGQDIILPANLLINLPNDFQTLQQLFTNAPAACQITKETGLAKNDKCNSRATGAQARILANRTDSGNVIAGVVDIFKALETVNGTVTFIDFTNGFFRLNGIAGDPATGVMVRVNDPISRNTVQQGPGCIPGNTVNCSPDVRFKIDPDNYTFAFVTGYPACIPTTANGLLDPNCPDANRPPIPVITTSNPFAFPPVAADSRHFAPVVLGDPVTADGSFETIGGVKFFSAWSVRVVVDLTTRTTDSLGNPDPTQPDYLIINDSSWDGPAYPAGRVRGRLLTNSTVRTSLAGVIVGTADIDYFSVHYDPVNNAPHEQILYTTQFNKQFGAVIFNSATGVSDSAVKMDFFPGAKILGNEPCLALLGFEPKATGIPVFPGLNISNYCTGSGTDTVQNFNLMVPVFREVMARSTRQRTTIGGGLAALDIHGRPSQSGQYKLPTIINYGAFDDINLGMGAVSTSFSGTPWLMDRRLSPNGCVGVCEATPQPLSPFPFEGTDPRTIAPTFGFVVLGAITQVPTPDRMFRFMDVNGNMTGLLAWPPANPGALPITPLPSLNPFPPIALDAFASTKTGTPVGINVLGNDRSIVGTIDPASLAIATQPGNGIITQILNGIITYSPNANFNGTDTFFYTVADSFGTVSSPAKVTVLVSPFGNTFLVTMNFGTNGVIIGPGTADANTSPSYTITPNFGFHIADVTVNGVSKGGVTSLTLPPVNGNITITASFAPNTFTVTKTATNGAITGPASADFSTTPVYTIAPSTGYHVVDVTVDGSSKGAVTSVTLPPVAANVAITASFAINVYTVTATGDAKGTMTPSGKVPVTHGTSQTFSFTPSSGYNVVNVLIDGVAQGPLTSYTLTNVTGEGHTVKAVFIPDGDVNSDGKVDIADALAAMQISVGLVTPSTRNVLHGDVAPLGADGVPIPDTKITPADALLILRKVVGLTSGW